jgi:hypothetical protein
LAIPSSHARARCVAEGEFEAFLGEVQLTGSGVGAGRVVAHRVGLGVHQHGAFRPSLGPREIAEIGQRGRTDAEHLRDLGILAEGFLDALQRAAGGGDASLRLPQRDVDVRQERQWLIVCGLQVGRPLDAKGGVGEVPGLPAAAAVEILGLEERRIQTDGPLESDDRLLRMTGGVERHASGGMRLSQVRRQLQSSAAVGQHAFVGDRQIPVDPEEGIAVRDTGIGASIARIGFHGLGEQSPRRPQILPGAPAHREPRPRLKIEFVGLRIGGRARPDRLQFLRQQFQLERGHDVSRDLVLKGEDVRKDAIETLGPEMAACPGVDQLGGYANPVSRLPDASLEDVADLQLAGELVDLHGLSLEIEGRVAGNDEDRRDLGEIGDDVLGDAIAEILLLRITAHIGERQDEDRRLRPRRIGARRRRPRLSRGSAIDPDRLGEILQPLFAEILEVEGNLASDLIQDSLGQNDGSGICQGFQASRDIDSIAVEIAVHDHHIAEIQADAQHQPPVVGQAPIGGLHGLLQLHRALDGSDRARELDQGAVAHQFDQAAAVLVDQRVEDVLARGLECRKRPRFVGAQEAAVADHIGNKNGCKPALHLLSPSPVEYLTSDWKAGRHRCEDRGAALVCGPCHEAAAGSETILDMW